MKRFSIIALLFASAFLFMSYSPAPTHRSFGGDIYYVNASSHDLFFVIDEPAGGFYSELLCLEKKDIVLRRHGCMVSLKEVNSFDRNSIKPNNNFSKISIYEMDGGALLKEIFPNDSFFVLKSGSIENNDAIYEVLINDSFLSGAP